MSEFVMERAVKDKLNIVEVFDHIFTEEAVSKRKRAIETQIQTSGFPMKKTLNGFDFTFQPSADKRQIDELATMRFLENGENIVFLDPPGVGETHLATALGLVAAEQICSFSLLPGGMRKPPPASPATKPSHSGTRPLPTSLSPRLSSTASCITAP